MSIIKAIEKAHKRYPDLSVGRLLELAIESHPNPANVDCAMSAVSDIDLSVGLDALLSKKAN